MTLSFQVESLLKKVFKSGNRYMVLLWRLGLSSWVNFSPTYGGQIMVLTYTGRKSGQERRTPLNFSEIDGDIYCTAGSGAVSDWYRNVLGQPQV